MAVGISVLGKVGHSLAPLSAATSGSAVISPGDYNCFWHLLEFPTYCCLWFSLHVFHQLSSFFPRFRRSLQEITRFLLLTQVSHFQLLDLFASELVTKYWTKKYPFCGKLILCIDWHVIDSCCYYIIDRVDNWYTEIDNLYFTTGQLVWCARCYIILANITLWTVRTAVVFIGIKVKDVIDHAWCWFLQWLLYIWIHFAC